MFDVASCLMSSVKKKGKINPPAGVWRIDRLFILEITSIEFSCSDSLSMCDAAQISSDLIICVMGASGNWLLVVTHWFDGDRFVAFFWIIYYFLDCDNMVWWATVVVSSSVRISIESLSYLSVYWSMQSGFWLKANQLSVASVVWSSTSLEDFLYLFEAKVEFWESLRSLFSLSPTILLCLLMILIIEAFKINEWCFTTYHSIFVI